ncbi:hypothetical protein EDEG_03154, partial [Edhazardia aedis USNM 41457]
MEFVFGDSLIVSSFEFGKFLKYVLKIKNRIITVDGVFFHKNGFITGGSVRNKFETTTVSYKNNDNTHTSNDSNNINTNNININAITRQNTCENELYNCINNLTTSNTHTFKTISFILEKLQESLNSNNTEKITHKLCILLKLKNLIIEKIKETKDEKAKISSVELKYHKITELNQRIDNLYEDLAKNNERAKFLQDYCDNLENEICGLKNILKQTSDSIANDEKEAEKIKKDMCFLEKECFKEFVEKNHFDYTYIQALRDYINNRDTLVSEKKIKLEELKSRLTYKTDILSREIDDLKSDLKYDRFHNILSLINNYKLSISSANTINVQKTVNNPENSTINICYDDFNELDTIMDEIIAFCTVFTKDYKNNNVIRTNNIDSTTSNNNTDTDNVTINITDELLIKKQTEVDNLKNKLEKFFSKNKESIHHQLSSLEKLLDERKIEIESIKSKFKVEGKKVEKLKQSLKIEIEKIDKVNNKTIQVYIKRDSIISEINDILRKIETEEIKVPFSVHNLQITLKNNANNNNNLNINDNPNFDTNNIDTDPNSNSNNIDTNPNNLNNNPKPNPNNLNNNP